MLSGKNVKKRISRQRRYGTRNSQVNTRSLSYRRCSAPNFPKIWARASRELKRSRNGRHYNYPRLFLSIQFGRKKFSEPETELVYFNSGACLLTLKLRWNAQYIADYDGSPLPCTGTIRKCRTLDVSVKWTQFL